MIKLIALTLLIAAIGFAAYVRVKPLDADALHIDPTLIERPPVGHALLRDDGDVKSPVFMIPASKLSTTLQQIIEATPRISLLAGDLAQGHATYVIRSQIFGFPDVASVKVVDLGNGMSSVAILSRQLVGQKDLGVNQARVEGWLKALTNRT